MLSLADEFRVRVAAHPWRSIGGAALVGAWLALEDRQELRHQLARLGRTAIRALVVRTGQRLVARVGYVTPLH